MQRRPKGRENLAVSLELGHSDSVAGGGLSAHVRKLKFGTGVVQLSQVRQEGPSERGSYIYLSPSMLLTIFETCFITAAARRTPRVLLQRPGNSILFKVCLAHLKQPWADWEKACCTWWIIPLQTGLGEVSAGLNAPLT